MSHTNTASAAIRAAAARAFLAGDRQRAYDLGRCDPVTFIVGLPASFGDFCSAMAAELVEKDSRSFAESLIKHDLHAVTHSSEFTWREPGAVARAGELRLALEALERMRERDALDLRYRFKRTQMPHLLTGVDAARLVLGSKV